MSFVLSFGFVSPNRNECQYIVIAVAVNVNVTLQISLRALLSSFCRIYVIPRNEMM